jgi:signal transduction histidine kinase/PAS domain-containing protein
MPKTKPRLSPPIALDGTQPIEKKYLSPERMLAILVIGIFLSEIVEMMIMRELNRVHPLAPGIEMLLDGLIMIVVAFPLIYYLAFRGLLRHIEERKHSEALLSRVLEGLPVGVWITDQKGTILHGNQASRDIWAGVVYVGQEQYGEYKAWWPDSGQPVKPEEWAAPRVIASGQAILNEEMKIECFDGTHKTILNSAVPILNHDAIQGAIVVNQDISGHKQTERLLAKQNQDLEELRLAENRQRQLAETLNEVSRALSQTLDFEKVLHTLLEYVMRLVPLDYAYIVVAESATDLTLRARRGYEAESEPKLTPGASFKLGEYPFLQQVMITHQGLLIPDTQEYPGWTTLITRAAVGSWLGIPLIAGNTTIGVLALQKSEPNFFNTKHIGLAEVVSAQAAVAIQNAWLFEQVRAGHERLQSLSRRLVEVQESERRYIARELHDEASQSLTALKFGLRLLEQEVHQPESLLLRVTELKRLTDGVLEELHRLAMGLRPASLDYLGLVAALEQLVKDSDQRYKMAVRFRATGFTEERRLPDHVETTIYRIVQEALTNAVRHANAKNVDVILEQREDKTVIIVEDDGTGFDTRIIGKSGHLGLVGMQERAQMLGAAITIESEPGCGTIIVVEVPHGN